MDYKEFSAKIKSKYPQYSDMNDEELARKMVAKFPNEYGDVTFAPPAVNIQKPQPTIHKPTFATAGSTETIASSPFGKDYAKQATQERGDIAKNTIAFGLPFLATGLSAGTAIPAAGALSATGEAVGQKVSDLITGQRTPTNDLLRQSAGAGIGGLVGEGVGRGLVGIAGKALAPFANGYTPEIDALAKKYGMTLPASSTTTNRAVPLIESIAGKSAFGNKLTQMTLKAEESLTRAADDVIAKIGSSPDASNAGIKIADGMNRYRSRFMDTKNALYDAAKINKGDVTLNPQNTISVLDDIISEIKNTANPDMGSLKYFQQLKKGLAGAGDEMRDKLAKQGFNANAIEKIMSQQKIQVGVDGTKALNTIKQIRRDTNPKLTTPIATGFEAELRKIGATLSDEFDNALTQARPDLAEALAKANSAYKEGITKLNSEFGKKIKRYSDAGQFDKIAESVLNRSTSVDDIPKIFEVVGEDGKNALKANLADRMIGETKRNAKQAFTPSIIDKTIKQFGDARLKAIYTPEEYNALKELSKLTYAVGAAQKVAEGSQTTFTAKMAGIFTLAFTNPPLALQFLTSDAAFAKAISSKAGQQYLRSGSQLSPVTKFAVPSATRVAGQSLGR